MAVGWMSRRCLVGLVAVAALSVTSPVVAEDGAGLAGVQRMLDALTRDTRFPGALVHRQDRWGHTVTLRSGTAELGSGRPMVGPEARLRIASTTKIFTSAVMLGLVDEGRVLLDAPVARYLPEMGVDGRITVRQLLQHTSGLANYRAGLDWDRIYTSVELAAIGLEVKPVFPVPGTGWAYSNTNYVLAGMVIERVTGRSPAEEVERRIIEPLRLRGTYWPKPDDHRIRGRHAREYGIDPAHPSGGRTDVTEYNVSVLDAGGALISTPSDLNRFYRALFDGDVVPPRMLAPLLATRPLGDANATAFPPGTEYGLGLMRFPLSCGGHYYGSPGDLAGVHVRGGIDDTGTRVTVYTTTLPTSLAEVHEVTDLVDAAFCAGR